MAVIFRATLLALITSVLVPQQVNSVGKFMILVQVSEYFLFCLVFFNEF